MTTYNPTEELPSSPGTESATVSGLATPLTLSGRTSPLSNDDQQTPEPTVTTQKKKKKKKSKKSLAPKSTTNEPGKDSTTNEGRSPVLCISRNKHWKYISSYHGPWLQLPVELLDTLLTVNLNPTTMLASEIRLLPVSSGNGRKHRDRILNTSDHTPPESLQVNSHTPLLPPPPSLTKSNKPAPPQIDPGVFKSVLNIRRLIDEASELSVRATSGLSSAELGSLRSSSGMNINSWTAAQSLGINPLGNAIGGGRSVTMSANRIYRLRALAVQKLAQAYKTDEIASSVMVMQGGSVFDDIAERVLKVDPGDVDAKYVHFFHEKIPSRQLAESTTTKVLDELIAAHPQTLEYYRTRGIVQCFRDEFPQAIKDFTFALKETRSIRKAKLAHHESLSSREPKQRKRRKGKAAHRTNGQAPAEGTSVMENDDSSDKEPTHPASSEDVPDPLEPQLLFFRGAAYLQQAIYLIESAVLSLEEIKKTPSADGVELRLCYLENGKYGGVEIGNPEGPLGKRDGAKLQAYAATLGEKSFKDHISQLLKKSMRDHEKFQSHFEFLESTDVMQEGDIVSQIQHAFQVVETNHRHGKDANATSNTDAPHMFVTYHPLLIESLFSVLICHLMLGDFDAILPLFVRTAAIAEGSEGCPVFLPPRSMAQAEFIEVLERLARGWRKGIQPHSLSDQRGKGRVVDTETLPSKTALISSPPVSRSGSYHEPETNVVASSSSTILSSGSIESQQALNEFALTSDTPRMPTSSEGLSAERRSDAAEALNCARILLAPVAKRQLDLAQKLAVDKVSSKATKPAPITIPLHGPKVEIILAWLGAIHLPELEG